MFCCCSNRKKKKKKGKKGNEPLEKEKAPLHDEQAFFQTDPPQVNRDLWRRLSLCTHCQSLLKYFPLEECSEFTVLYFCVTKLVSNAPRRRNYANNQRASMVFRYAR